MAFDSSRTVAASRNQQCGDSVQKTLKLSRLLQKDLIKTYKASQGEMSELFCKVSVNNVPDPNISGLEPSEKIASIYTHLQEFFPHFEWVYEQQTDFQLPTSPLLSDLSRFRAGSRNQAYLIKPFYQSLFPNVPLQEGGPTTLPPPQKVYGCVVLKTRELRSLKSQVCRKRTHTNTLF
ncbi:hypothetical protein JOQ06_023787 [Pogonophryne albipinna]|uniref:Ciliary neurotrophic factor n=1 Tax=Pogonophryne albipinna TaxID=1090488 RepID=A0AAD6FU83_9TELE|nr:hypothetical protein JOQ06_023787 [Pogonophryne albipinna]